MSRGKQPAAGYIAIVAACYALGVFAGWLPVGINNFAYDYFTRAAAYKAPKTESVVVAIDEATYARRGGTRRIRSILAEAMEHLAAAKPKVVAIDVTLPDQADSAEDERLELAMRGVQNLVLPCKISGTQWEDPAPLFGGLAKGYGHVHTEKDKADGVNRQIMLEAVAGGERRWALALEAFSAARGQRPVDSPEEVLLGNDVIPAPRANGRTLRIRYLPLGTIPTVSVLDIDRQKDLLRGKTVFVGVTDLSAAEDRLVNPYRESVAGVEVHAQLYETLAHGDFLASASNLTLLGVCALFALACGLVFAFLSGWPAYSVAVLLVAAAALTPYQFFRAGVDFPFAAPVAVAWLCSAGASIYQHFATRWQLRKSESERSRYQQAIHWAAHEMRTPLTAIQGSSEIMAHYKLPEQKQHQLSEMINSESKRLSRIIQTFLDVERLAEGQMELKREPFGATPLIDACLRRVDPIAERKNIRVTLDASAEATLLGDRELMEYALYNLLTNAVKYSSPGTHVQVTSGLRGAELRLAVRDQGMGMDAKEVKQIFNKFYRTKRAEASGEVGTGIGLSIVDQIVTHHGGRIEVTSTPGEGSCFTMILRAQPASNAQTVDRGR